MRKSILLIIAVVGFAYAGGIAYFSNHFLPNSTINGTGVSYNTASAAESMIKPETRDDLVVLDKDGDQDIISMESIGYEVKNSETASDVLKYQETYKWPISFLSDHPFNLKVESSYDAESLTSVIGSMGVVKKQVAPVDAHIEKTDNGYEIIPEKDGSTLDMEKVEALISNAIDKGETSVDLAANDCYLKAKVRSDDEKLNKKIKKINKFIDKTITINMTAATETIGRKELSDYITKKGKVKVTDDKIAAYVDRLCEKYETYGTERPFKTTGGNEIEVGGSSKDTYGFWMDREATAQMIKDAILAEGDSEVTPEWKVWSLTRDQENGDIGNTYVEVGKDAQHLWFYKDGSLAYECDVVTGLPTAQRETPSGVFRILLKETDHTMKDESYSGTAHCAYWMAITWQGVGFHDATWQSSFGGNRYQSNGSHGCINLSLDSAKTLYAMVDNNVPVVIY